MNKQKIFITVSLAIGALATFFPWINMPLVGAINGSAGDGWFSFGMLAIAIIGLIYDKRKEKINTVQLWLIRIMALLSLLLGVWKINSISSIELFGETLGMGVVGTGLYVLILASIASILLTVPMIYQKIGK